MQLRGHGAREPSNLTLSQRTLSTPGAVPTEVATGDVNGDGKVDVAAAFAASGRIAVALGNGDGTFGAFTTVATDGAQSEMGLATADINGDGRDDVAVGDSTGAAVYRWTATGFVLITRASTARATDLRVADLDEDGFQDLAVIDAVGRRISFFLGTGSTFTAAGDRALNGTPREFQIVDFEGGIRPDFVLSNTAGAVAPFSTEILSQATAGFAPSRMLPLTVTTPTLPAAIAVGHFDGSGQLDLTTGDRVLLYPADPSGATTGPVTVESGAGGEAIAVADFDGDGRDDQALATSATGRVAVQRSLGGGLFAEPDVFTVPVVSGSQPADIASADLNGDGRPDVIASNGGAGLSVLLNGASFTAASGVGRALIDQFRRVCRRSCSSTIPRGARTSGSVDGSCGTPTAIGTPSRRTSSSRRAHRASSACSASTSTICLVPMGSPRPCSLPSSRLPCLAWCGVRRASRCTTRWASRGCRRPLHGSGWIPRGSWPYGPGSRSPRRVRSS